jgi:hypothetical protein
MKRFARHWMLLTVVVFTLQSVGAADDVTKQALKVLERHCLSCHNDIDHEGDLTLETGEALRDSGLVEPGHALDSHLLTVVSPDGDAPPLMPRDADPLSDAELQILRDWIDKGAAWPDGYRLQPPANDNFDWWSFKPLAKPEVPQFEAGSTEAGWIQSPIDAFVAARHREHGLTHATEADRRTLIRRLYYDLTGLPPTPAEIQQFVNDEDPLAWDKLIDRLLDSDHYGERWARHWLDVVKYADTCGYDKDKLRPNAWPYRDYVIESFNADKPYAQFVQEQVAGDILFPGNPDGIRALGFIAAGPWDFIGHAEVSEDKIDGQVARNLDRDDMVSNTFNTFCSVTIQCARCHNHKFDPFTQEHYYSLQSIFAAVDKAERRWDTSPEIEEQRRSLAAQLKTDSSALKAHQQTIEDTGGDELKNARAQVAQFQSGRKEAIRSPLYGYHSHIAKKPNTTKWVEVDLGELVDVQEIRLRACSDDYANIGPGFGFPVRFRVEVSPTPIDDTPAVRLGNFDSADVANPRLVPVRIPADGTQIRFIRITATHLAARSNDYIFALSELEAIDPNGTNVALNATVTAKDSIEAAVRWKKANLTDGLFPQSLDPSAAEKLAAAEAGVTHILNQLKTPAWVKQQEALETQIAELKKQQDSLPTGKMVYAAATHFKSNSNFKPTKGVPRAVRLLHRGNVTQPLNEMSPGVVPLSADADWKLPLDKDHTEGDRRAALAAWLSNRDNPLTWRSVANRIWQYHFGQAIAQSPNDFGQMGLQPTHPDLLNWLAVEFRDNGQSFKHLHRLILKSAAWRQASTHNNNNAAIDGSNQFLWHHTRRRLSAEELRDSVLTVSGRMNLKMGGPAFYLFALEKTAHSPHYEYHKFDPNDKASHRRSVYRFIVRSQPDPFMTTLDCADSSQSTPKRLETFTPLQALSLMNNQFTLVMATAFSERMLAVSQDPSEQIASGFALCTGRTPTEAELQAMTQFAKNHGLPATSRLLFNLNEFIFID